MENFVEHDIVKKHHFKINIVSVRILEVLSHAQTKGLMLAPEVAHLAEINGASFNTHCSATHWNDVIIRCPLSMERDAEALFNHWPSAKSEAFKLLLIPDGKRKQMNKIRLPSLNDLLYFCDVDALGLPPSFHHRRDDSVLKIEEKMTNRKVHLELQAYRQIVQFVHFGFGCLLTWNEAF